MAKEEMLYEGMSDFQAFLELTKGKPCKITIEPVEGEKLRSLQQNKALHLDFKNTAKILNDNGITAEALFSCAKDAVPVNESIVKQYWHSVLELMGMPPKTSKLTQAEVSIVREAIERAFAIKFGLDIGDFPSLESLRFNQAY